MIAEQLQQSFLPSPEISAAMRATKPSRTLITDEPWDRYHLESLLPLKETFQENTKFGFLLRHYWIPATALTFRRSSRVTLSDGNVHWLELKIEREMARCRSNECLWRDKTYPIPANGDGDPTVLSETLCSYNCYDQTYASAKPILFAPPSAEQDTEARRQALYRLPMLVPPGPLPLGFRWHAKVGEDYMTFRLEAEERLGGTSVLVIRREGRYTTWLPEEKSDSHNGQEKVPVVCERRGLTLFAWNRGAVLEDRLLDRILDGAGTLACRAGMTCQVVTRLVRSSPAE